MKKPRRKGAPRVRQINGCRFVIEKWPGGWWAHCRYADEWGGGRYSAACPTGHPDGRTARASLLSMLHDSLAPSRRDPLKDA